MTRGGVRKAFVFGGLVLLVLVLLVVSVQADHSSEKEKVLDKDSRITVYKGDLGKFPHNFRRKNLRRKVILQKTIEFLETPRIRKKMGINTPKNDAEQIRKGDTKGKRKAVVFDRKSQQVHVYLQAYLHHRKVYGGEIEVHIETDTRKVYSISGNRLLVSEVNRSGEKKRPTLKPQKAIAKALSTLRKRKEIKSETVKRIGRGKAELCYVYDGKDKGRLVYKFRVKYQENKGPQRSTIFVSAHTGKIISERKQVALARDRNTRDSEHSFYSGKVILSENSALTDTNDQAIRDTHRHLGTTYDFFKTKFNRDSIDGKGMTINANQHVGLVYDTYTAYWFEGVDEIFFGDGDFDQVLFKNPGHDITLVAHEYGHGVVQYTAGLVHQGEPGALNEATADIFAASVRMHSEGGATNWKIGDKSALKNGAFRFMDNPTKDGSSKDYYPERYQGSEDEGGIHWNSGIANLFFVLLSQGGAHPRGKAGGLNTPGITREKALQIWYRALTLYFPNTCTFAQARTHTVSAAEDLYGATSREAHSVKEAWYKVGVGANPGPWLTPPNFDGQILRFEIEGGISNGKRYLSCPSSGRYMDLWFSDDQSGRQRFIARKLPDGPNIYSLQIFSGIHNSDRKYLSVSPDGTFTDLWPRDDGSRRQRWEILPKTHTLSSISVLGGVSTSRRLLSSYSDGSRVDLWPRDDSSGRQRWIVHRLSSPNINLDGRLLRFRIAGGISGGKKYLSTNWDGTRVDLWYSDDHSGRQRWRAQRIGRNLYRFRVERGVTGSRSYLSINHHGSWADLWSHDDNSGRQQWFLAVAPGGTYYLKAIDGISTGRTLLSSSSNGGRVDLWYEDDHSLRQRWIVEFL